MSIEVTQADRDAAGDILDEVSSLLDHIGIGQVADLIRDGEYDEHEVLGITARHRQQAVAAEVEKIVAWHHQQAEWHDKYDDGLSGFDRIAQAHRESIEAIERGEYKETNGE